MKERSVLIHLQLRLVQVRTDSVQFSSDSPVSPTLSAFLFRLTFTLPSLLISSLHYKPEVAISHNRRGPAVETIQECAVWWFNYDELSSKFMGQKMWYFLCFVLSAKKVTHPMMMMILLCVCVEEKGQNLVSVEMKEFKRGSWCLTEGIWVLL